jgi:hypothetical protein
MKQNLNIILRLALVAVFAFATGVAGQVLTGTLSGTVMDPTDAVIPGARVTVTDLATGRTYATTTDSSGNFAVTNLPNGFFSVLVEAEGFAKFQSPRVQVNVAQSSRVVAKMELAKAGSEVIVTSEQSVVETESAELKNSVDRKQIMQLPLPTRNPLDLVRTMPGVVTPNTSGIADAFVHGLRGNSTNITQDGINVADNFVKTSSFFAISAPTVDSTGEFNVSTGGVGVDAGFGGAQVSIRTQRGSSDFHGSVYWYQRTNAFNANTWFNNANGSPRPYQLRNTIGVSAGGPVYIPKVYEQTDKTFLFGTYEAFREPLSRSRTRTVLTSTARMGDFTYMSGGAPVTVNLLTMPGTAGLGLNSDVMNYYNAIVPAPNATSGCSNDGFNTQCFTFNLPGASNQDRYVIRADHQLTPNNSIEFVYTRANFSSIPDLLNGIEPNFPLSTGGGQVSHREVYSAAWHSSWGANKTNEVRFGLQRAPVAFDLFEDYAATGTYQLNLPLVTDPTIVQGNLPQGRNTPVRQLMDNFSWSKGSHLFRFGGEWRLVLADSYFFNTVVPSVGIGAAASNTDGLSAADFTPFGAISSGDLSRARNIYQILTGLVASVTQGFNHTSPTSGFVAGVPRTVDPIQHNLSGYFQDQWKMWPNLTLNYGVRYEYQGVFDLRNGLVLQPELEGLNAVFGPAGLNNQFTPISTPVVNDILLNFSGHNNGKPIYQRDINNFAPYVGFAWDPFKDGKTSIRGAGTVHFTQDGFTLFQLAGTGNTGLFSVVSNSSPAQNTVFSTAGNPNPPAPTAVFPVSQRQNQINNIGANLWTFDPALKTPYVINWNLSVSRELWNRITVEARYVGNHAVKLFRSTDYNEINLLSNPYSFGGNSVANLLTEFQNAQNNLAIQGGTNFSNAGLAGQVPLPIFEALFQGIAASSGFASSTFVTNLNEGELGRLFDTLRRSNTYRTNREANFPLNFFVPNPFANAALFVDNSSWSYYHGGEFEVRRRFSSGLFFQANYTFSKVIADTRFLTSQNEFGAYQSIANRRLDKNRAAFDVTHSFSANFIYPLPFGRGQKFASNVNAIVHGVIGGWSIQGFTRVSSGAPMASITAARVTAGAFITDLPVHLRNMNASQLQEQIGVFKRPEGVYWLNPDSGLLNISGGNTTATICTPGQTTPCFDFNTAGELAGNLPYFGLDGPKFVNQDFSIIKRIDIWESLNMDIRFEFFNAFNHPNFGGLTTNIESSSFGELSNTVDTVRGGGVTSRIIQWAVRVNW